MNNTKTIKAYLPAVVKPRKYKCLILDLFIYFLFLHYKSKNSLKFFEIINLEFQFFLTRILLIF